MYLDILAALSLPFLEDKLASFSNRSGSIALCNNLALSCAMCAWVERAQVAGLEGRQVAHEIYEIIRHSWE